MAATRNRRTTTRPTQDLAIRSLINAEPPEDALATIIAAWARQQRLPSARLLQCRFLAPIMDAANGSLESVHKSAARLPRITLKDIEGVFESVIDRERRKKQGAVYTPNFVIDYLLRHGLRFSKPSGPAARFCDPACGSGGFLVRALDILARRSRTGLPETLSRCVRGLDNDPQAIRHARALVSLQLLKHGSTADDVVEGCVQPCDSLLATRDEIGHVTGFASGADLLATNPPYVKLQNLVPAYRKALLQRYAGFASGNYSLALLFLVAGQRMLSPAGALAFITQNNLFTSLAGRSVRAHLQASKSIRRIVDFGHQHVFPNASTYTCLMFVANSPAEEFEFERTTGPVTSASLHAAEFSRIRHSALDADKWRLAGQPHLDHLRRIEQTGIPLGQLAKISVGFATLKDSVFHLDGQVDPTGATFHTRQGDEIELGATRRAIRVSDALSENDVTANQRCVIFPYKRNRGCWELLPEDELRARFPQTYAYLLARRDLLATRDKGRRQYGAWYAWARTQGRQAPGPKLLTKTFSPRPNFMLDESDQLFCNGYSVLALRGFDVRCLQRILNSSLMHYYAKLTSFQIEGDYQCYQKNFIQRFGVPDLSAAQQRELAACRLAEADELVRRHYGIADQEIRTMTQHLASV